MGRWTPGRAFERQGRKDTKRWRYHTNSGTWWGCDLYVDARGLDGVVLWAATVCPMWCLFWQACLIKYMASLKRSTGKDTSSAAQIHERVHKKVTSEDLQNYTLIFCMPHIGTNLMTHVLNNSNYSNESQQAVAKQLKEMLHLNELKMCFGNCNYQVGWCIARSRSGPNLGPDSKKDQVQEWSYSF